MKYKKILVWTLGAFLCFPLKAQWRMAPTPNDTLQSVRIEKDGSVVLSIYAPQAQNVRIGGDIVPWGKELKVVKSDDGVWSIKVP